MDREDASTQTKLYRDLNLWKNNFEEVVARVDSVKLTANKDKTLHWNLLLP